MKYFTPDLLERFASGDDRIALAAQDELEQRSEAYGTHLKEIAKKLPPRFLEVQERFYLHDARVVGPPFPWFHPEAWWEWPFRFLEMEQGLWPSLLLTLQLDPPPQEFLVLHYRFVRIEEVRRYPPLVKERLPFLEWRHDEVELITSDEHPDFGHSILFTGGIELRLRFRDFDYATLKPMAPPPESKSPIRVKHSRKIRM